MSKQKRSLPLIIGVFVFIVVLLSVAGYLNRTAKFIVSTSALERIAAGLRDSDGVVPGKNERLIAHLRNISGLNDADLFRGGKLLYPLNSELTRRAFSDLELGTVICCDSAELGDENGFISSANLDPSQSIRCAIKAEPKVGHFVIKILSSKELVEKVK